MAPKNGTEKSRAVGYCRVSTASQVEDKDGEEKESLPGQRRLIEAHASMKGWELAGIYEDGGITGKKDDRPGLKALLDAARQREFDAVIVRDLSRFGRSARDLLNNIERLKDLGVVFVALKENIELKDNDPYSQFLFQILSAVAELEHSMIYERMRDGKMAKWRDKRTFVGSLPLGYRWNKQAHAIEIAPEEAQIYQRIVAEYLDFGKSITDIGLGLTRDAVPTRLNGKWQVAAISKVLRNPAYYGILTATSKQYDKKGKETSSEDIMFECPPLITKARWDEIQERLGSARQRSGRPIVGASQFLLYGMLRCGECGGKMLPHLGAKAKDGSQKRYYICHWRRCGKNQRELAGRDMCSMPIIPAEKIEGYLWSANLMVRLGLNAEKHIGSALDLGGSKWEEKIEAAQRRLEQIQEALKKKGIALRNVDSLLEDPDFDSSVFKAKRNGILAEIHVLNQQVEEATAEIERLRQIREQEDLLAKFATDRKGALKAAHKRIMSLPDEGKQRLMRGMLAGPVTVKEPLPGATLDEYPYMPSWLDFSFRFNPAILKEILEEGAEGDNPISGLNHLSRTTLSMGMFFNIHS